MEWARKQISITAIFTIINLTRFTSVAAQDTRPQAMKLHGAALCAGAAGDLDKGQPRFPQPGRSVHKRVGIFLSGHQSGSPAKWRASPDGVRTSRRMRSTANMSGGG